MDDDNWEPDGPIDLGLSADDEAMIPVFKPRKRPREFVWKMGDRVCIDLNPCVFITSFVLIWGFVIWLSVVDDAEAASDLGEIQSIIVRNWSWFYVGALNSFMVFCAYIAFSSYGDIRLGQKPDFNYATWITMLFSAGIGIGLYFYGIQEPLTYYASLTRHNVNYLRPEAVTEYNAAKTFYQKLSTCGKSGTELCFDNSYFLPNGTFPTNAYNYNPATAFTYESRFLRALDAMNLSFFNWGYSASSTYVIVGLPLAYYHYNYNLPLSMRTAFYPIIGNRINGWFGDVVDIFSICGTVFGVCTSLGLGVMQLAEGLNFTDDSIPGDSKDTYSVIILVVTFVATISVVTGLEVGIRRMSELNFFISMTLFILIFFMSNPPFFLDFFMTSFTYHFQNLLYLMGYADGFEKFIQQNPNDIAAEIGAGDLSKWTSWWTVFYWAWWISWSPFVGMFLAKISKGRTIREFIIVNVGVTTVLVMIWFVVFGGQAFLYNMKGENMGLNCLPEEFCKAADKQYCGPFDPHSGDLLMFTCFLSANKPVAGASGGSMLWYLLDNFPFSGFLVPLGIVGLSIFFITSSDSASQVVDEIASNGRANPPVWQRILWAVTEGATALALLHAGENPSDALRNLQTVSLIFALPLTAVMIGMMFSFWVGLRTERGEIKPKNFWAVKGVDAFGQLVGTFFCLPCCFGGGATMNDWLWAASAAFFPCVPQVKTYLDFSAAENARTGKTSGFGKMFWIFMLVAPWIAVWVFSCFCEENAMTAWGPVGKDCYWLDGVEGWLGWCYFVMVLIGVIQRGWVRSLRGIEKPSNTLMDIGCLCFCPSVAVFQALKEPRDIVKLDEEEEDPKNPVAVQMERTAMGTDGEQMAASLGSV